MDKDNNDTIGRSGSSTGPVKPHMGRGGPPRGGDSPMGPGGPSPGFQLAAFSSLKIRSFRWLWFGNFFAFNAMQMQIVARGWLVYAMSDSPLALGIVSAGFGLPMIIFSLFGGTLADRVRKRNLLMTTQSTMAVVTLVITILITIDKIALWHLFGASLATGMIFSFMMPARQAFIVDLVDEKDYLNAISLGSMAMNTCRIASPALAGVLIKFIGIPGVYWIVSISHICVVLTTTRIPPGAHMAARAEAPIMSDILEGLRYVKNNRIIISLLILGFVPMLIVMPYQMLMPVFARDIFKAGETGLGILMSTSGIGALVGSIVIASMGDYQKKGMLMLVTGVFFGLFLIPFAPDGITHVCGCCSHVCRRQQLCFHDPEQHPGDE